MRALVAILLLALVASCSRRAAETEMADTWERSIDSAYLQVWYPDEAVGDAHHHSALYDSALVYIRLAIQIEASKREYASSVAQLDPLGRENLKSRVARRHSVDTLEAILNHMDLWERQLDTLDLQFSNFAHNFLGRGQAFLPSKSVQWKKLTRRTLFQPRWRPQYDSIERAVAESTLDIVRLVDSNANVIDVTDEIHLGDASVAASLAALRSRLDSLTSEETKLAHDAH